MENLQGIIIKGIGGFYYVEVADKIYECKARGIFRKRGFSPVVGDIVEISEADDGYNSIEKILPRKNSLIRPALANIDKLVIVVSTCEPAPNLFITDKMTAAAIHKEIEPIIVISKCDLANGREIKEIYDSAGFKTVEFSAVSAEGADEVKKLIKGGITAFSGNSGVGKSSLLNVILPELNLQTGEISTKLGRGRHTTRTVELYKTEDGYVADTPGFSTVDIERYEMIKKDEIMYCFPEFEDYLDKCRFTSCAHICEKGCAVLEAVENGKISSSRHSSYAAMYNEVKDFKEWEHK